MLYVCSLGGGNLRLSAIADPAVEPNLPDQCLRGCQLSPDDQLCHPHILPAHPLWAHLPSWSFQPRQVRSASLELWDLPVWDEPFCMSQPPPSSAKLATWCDCAQPRKGTFHADETFICNHDVEGPGKELLSKLVANCLANRSGPESSQEH